MAEPARHRQTKRAATDMFDLQPPRHTSTLPRGATRSRVSSVRFSPLAASGHPEVRDRGDAGEEPCHGLTREVPGDEDQARSPVIVGPVFELDRRMGDVLDDMNDDRPTAFGERHEALDA